MIQAHSLRNRWLIAAGAGVSGYRVCFKEEAGMIKIALMVVMIVVSIILTASILFQSGNSAGLSGSIGGGAEQLFGKKKSSGYEGILSKITTVCAVIFFVVAVVMTALQD